MTVSLDREKQILEYLQNKGSASIQQLADAFGVSNMTIHRDLNKLAQAGRILKKHGGATLPSKGNKLQEEISSCDVRKTGIPTDGVHRQIREWGGGARVLCPLRIDDGKPREKYLAVADGGLSVWTHDQRGAGHLC